MSKVLYLVVPCYNEEEVLYKTSNELEQLMRNLIKAKKVAKQSKILYVDDGSKDKTWNIIKEKNLNNNLFVGLKLSRNRGHQNALLAGLMYVKDKADMVISLDADLQDDINVIDCMIDKYDDGYEIVYGVRNNRKNDSKFKKWTAEAYYKFLNFLGVDIVYNHADYRLLSRIALNMLAEFKEVNLFLRGIVPLIGLKSTCVYYERKKRGAGETKYPLKKMIALALDGVTSFSIKPLRLILLLGVLILFISIFIMIYSVIRKITGNTVTGWTFIVISIWFIGGIQMISIGILGEYIGKVYSETKARPKYFIEEVIN